MSENREGIFDPSMGGGKSDAALDAYNARLEKEEARDKARIKAINEANQQFIADTQRSREGQVDGEVGGATPFEADQTTPVSEPNVSSVDATLSNQNLDDLQESIDPNSRPESQ